MPGSCAHGFAPAECLICRTLGAPPGGVAEGAPARPDRIYDPAVPPSRRRRRLGGPLIVAAVGLLAVGAALWILAGVVFTALHVLELIVVAAGAGWVGYRIGHFRGSRGPRSPG